LGKGEISADAIWREKYQKGDYKKNGKMCRIKKEIQKIKVEN
jgi:hypothetical protein